VRLVEKIFDMRLVPNISAQLTNVSACPSSPGYCPPAVFPATIDFNPSYSTACSWGQALVGCCQTISPDTRPSKAAYNCECGPTPNFPQPGAITTVRVSEILIDTVLGPTLAIAAAAASAQFPQTASPTPAPSYAAAAAGLGGAVAFLVLVLIALVVYILFLKGQLKPCACCAACFKCCPAIKLLPKTTSTKMGADWARSPQRLKTSALDLAPMSPLAGIAMQTVPPQPPPGVGPESPAA
jgi:hypothetical protein